MRVNLLQTMQGDYVEAARARGISERSVVYRHAFRNALVPVVTVIGLQFALLLGGAVLTEDDLQLAGHRLRARPLPQQPRLHRRAGHHHVFALVVVFISLLIDIVNALIDPRVRY